MKIQITSRKFKAKDSLKDFIKDELNSLEKLSDGILDADVILSYELNKDSLKIAEIIIKIPGKILTAKEQSDDFNKSVSAAVSKIKKQLEKLKTQKMTQRNEKLVYEV